LKEGEAGTDATRLFSEQRTFEDSKRSLGLQLADILATILRRALNENLQRDGWKDIGKLFAGRKIPFVMFNQGDNSSRSLDKTPKRCSRLSRRNPNLASCQSRRCYPEAHQQIFVVQKMVQLSTDNSRIESNKALQLI
jgi:Protein of unknown function (DUF3800)